MCPGNWNQLTPSHYCQRGRGRGASRWGCTATRTTPALPRPAGLGLKKAEPCHPPFASRGSGCLTAGRQISGPRGAGAGSSLFHFPHYFERTPFQDLQTCGHRTCLLNETQVKSAGKKRRGARRKSPLYLWKSLCFAFGGMKITYLNMPINDSRETD